MLICSTAVAASCSICLSHSASTLTRQAADSHESVGTQHRRFNIHRLRKISIVLLPPLPEQRAIATALSDVDGLLGGLDRLIAKKRDLKQAAMQQLLTGQTRLPGFHGEWEVKRLGDVADVRSRQTPSPTNPLRSARAIALHSRHQRHRTRILRETTRKITVCDRARFSRHDSLGRKRRAHAHLRTRSAIAPSAQFRSERNHGFSISSPFDDD